MGSGGILLRYLRGSCPAGFGAKQGGRLGKTLERMGVCFEKKPKGRPLRNQKDGQRKSRTLWPERREG